MTAEIDQDGVEVVLKPLLESSDRQAMLLETRWEADRSLVQASDRSGLDAHSLDPPDAASPRMAGLVGQRLLIVFISVPSNPLRLPDDSNNSASRPNVVCAGLLPGCLLAGRTQ